MVGYLGVDQKQLRWTSGLGRGGSGLWARSISVYRVRWGQACGDSKCFYFKHFQLLTLHDMQSIFE